MLDYSELYDYLRKEKYSEQLQNLPSNFLDIFTIYSKEMKNKLSENDSFSGDVPMEKKQYENSLSIFRELMLRRKKKILNLVFIAAETDILVKDLDLMLGFEKDLFKNFIKNIRSVDEKLTKAINGNVDVKNKKLVITEDIEEFVDLSGNSLGPFKQGAEVDLKGDVAEILISGGKAKYSN